VLGPRLHSAYLYGSVARGDAVPGRSDLDLVAVLTGPPSEADRAAADRAARDLEARVGLLSGAAVVLGSLAEVTAPDQRYGWQPFLRELSFRIAGTDLRPGFPRTRPSPELAAGFHADTPAVLARARVVLAGPDPPPGKARAAARLLVRAAFAVVMAADGVWATVLEEQAAIVARAVPAWAGPVALAVSLGRAADPDPSAVLGLLATFWPEVEAAMSHAFEPSRPEL
jgi:uncharacterized protein